MTNNTQNNTIILEECGPCPIFASFTLAFALQLRKNNRNTSTRVRKTSDYSQARNDNRTLKIYIQTRAAGEHLMAEHCDDGRNIF
jgi:hypothetical protein